MRDPGPAAQAYARTLYSSDLWRLHAAPGALRAAAAGWRGFAGQVPAAVDPVWNKAYGLVAGAWTGSAWSGSAAETYHQHLARLTGDARGMAEQARRMADALDGIAGDLEIGQQRLDASWAWVSERVAAYPGGVNQIVFRAFSDDEVGMVETAVTDAQEIRRLVADWLLGWTSQLRAARGELAPVIAAWQDVDAGRTTGWEPPPEIDGVTILTVDGRTIVNTGSGDDTIDVTVNGDGLLVVTVGSEVRVLPAGTALTVRGGSGRDVITVAKGITVRLTLLGGSGSDTITGGDGDDTILGLTGQDRLVGRGGNDRISGGADRDYLDGGTGDDLLVAGSGHDTVYGGDGVDQLAGQDGKDYLDGGRGDDVIDGDAGGDTITGGRGDDVLRGGTDDDVVYAGDGRDTVDGQAGADTLYAQNDDVAVNTEKRVTVDLLPDTETEIVEPWTTVNGVLEYRLTTLDGAVKVIGSPEFLRRIADDIDTLRASPTGQRMLAAFQEHYRATQELPARPGEEGTRYKGDDVVIFEYEKNGGQMPGRAAAEDPRYHRTFLNINPAYQEPYNGPPITVLQHEMAHAYQNLYNLNIEGVHDSGRDDGVENDERAAVGVPVDDDNDEDTPDRTHPRHPYGYTENALRDEMGVERTPTYRFDWDPNGHNDTAAR